MKEKEKFGSRFLKFKVWFFDMMVLNLYIKKKRYEEMILHHNIYTRSDLSMDFVLVSLHLQFSLSDLKEKSP